MLELEDWMIIPGDYVQGEGCLEFQIIDADNRVFHKL